MVSSDGKSYPGETEPAKRALNKGAQPSLKNQRHLNLKTRRSSVLSGKEEGAV